MSTRTRKQQEAQLPRGPLEELGALKQRRLTVALMADAVAHIVGASTVTIVVTMPEGFSEKAVTFSTSAYVTQGRGLHGFGADQQTEAILGHLKWTEDNMPEQHGKIRAGLERAAAERFEAEELDRDLVEQAVPEEAFAVEEHHR